MDVIAELRPEWVLFENVPGMKDAVISTDHGLEGIVDYIERRLGDEYVGTPEVVSCADYGIPQLRKRLITIYTRTRVGKEYFQLNEGTFFPPRERTARATVWDAIGKFPPLDGSVGKNARTDFHPFHYVNCMNPEKYWWVSNTPEGETAYNNQCANPACLYQGNARHLDELDGGRWVSSKTTPIYCMRCGELLPRPTMIDPITGNRRLIRGFHSAYRRMEKSKPARTLTRNFPFEASDNKIHPEQHRVLSVYEALVIQTITDYEFKWEFEGRPSPRSLIAQAIGESVPPRLVDFIVSKIKNISIGAEAMCGQLSLL